MEGIPKTYFQDKSEKVRRVEHKQKLSLTEEDGNIVLILDQCLKGAGSDVLNLVNTMIIMDMTFRIDGFLLA